MVSVKNTYVGMFLVGLVRRKAVQGRKEKGRTFMGSGPWKRRRLPTLAQAIHALPSATLRLTVEFGMGSSRTATL